MISICPRLETCLCSLYITVAEVIQTRQENKITQADIYLPREHYIDRYTHLKVNSFNISTKDIKINKIDQSEIAE